jgi:hypothetical protein
MVYNTQNYWVSGLHPSSGILNTRKHNIPVIEVSQPLWSNGQSSWFDSRRYQNFREVVGLEQGPFSLVSTIEELLERKSSSSDLENREYCRGDPLH